MKSLIAKEIRLLLPAFIVALVLAIAPAWFFLPTPAISLFCFGATLLALSAFGREFSLNTFQVLLAQPLERNLVWRTKMSVLTIAMAWIFGAWLFSNWWIHLCTNDGPFIIWNLNPLNDFFDVRGPIDWSEPLTTGGIAILAIISGALWTSLLLRQLSAAFWFTILLPATIATLVDVFGGGRTTVFTAMILYSIIGLWLARRLFFRAQEVPWTGVTIDIPGLPATADISQARRRTPWLALLRAEFRLHQVSLISISGLFLVHLCTLFFLKSDNLSIARTAQAIADLCALLWFVIPAMVGATGVAEERKLGTIESRLCLPVSARRQFTVKLLLALLIGGYFVSVLYCVRGHMYPHSKQATMNFYGVMFENVHTFRQFLMATIVISIPFSVIASLSFYGSTISRNFIQALMAGIIAIVLVFAVGTAATMLSLDGAGILPWRNTLVYFIGIPVMFLVLLSLSFRNFRRLLEPRRLFKRNLLAIAGGLLFTGTLTAGIYNRMWESLTPIEPAHGPARIKADKPVSLHPAYQNGGAIVLVLPDGRLWQSRLYIEGAFKISLLYPWREKWTSLAGNHFVDGTNWVDAVDAFSKTFAIRNDGTLWSSKEPHRDHMGELQVILTADPSMVTNQAALKRNSELSKLLRNRFNSDPPDKLVQYGNASDWKSLTALVNGKFLALTKTDGSVWHGFPAWDENTPTRFLAATNGFEMMTVPSRINESYEAYLWDKQGQARTGLPGKLMRWPSLDQTHWRCIVEWSPYWPGWIPLHAGVRDDGSLWCWHSPFFSSQRFGQTVPPNLVRIGTDSDWASVASDARSLFGLKKDGSLWMWVPNARRYPNDPLQGITISSGSEPVQLGTHRDWLAICNGAPGMDGTIALAADGNLWWWRSQDLYPPFGGGSFLTAPSKKPVKLCNIFDQ